jgi:photosystem II stability/assembly factor-like uncharacterized protein
MVDMHESIPEEVDEQNQRLIQNLRRMCPTSAQMAQSLARVQQRLFYSGDGTQQDEMSTPPPFPQRILQARTSTANLKGNARQRRFGTLAAAVFATLLVGTLILVLYQARQSRTGGAGTPSNQGEAIVLLHMIDATTGWAVTQKAVLRTIDGGAHWHDVTPPRFAFIPGSTMDFLTASLAWIALPQAGQTTTAIVRTSDGGAHWQQATIQTPFVKQIMFINAQYGWLLSGKENAAGAATEAVSVFRTADGGKTWQRLSSALFADTTPPGHLPYSGQKSGVHFLNASTGWVTGTSFLPNLAWLYVTHDGGSTWHQQTLPMPQGVSSAQLSILAPTFFSATDGILPVSFADIATKRGIAIIIYMTHDGGKTWRSTMPVFVALSASHFLDMQHGWLTDGATLFVTSDSGQHWAKLASSANFKRVTLLDFVSATTGWAIGNRGNGSVILLKTSDGGQTWRQITPLIS